MPTPTIPKRTLSLGEASRGNAISGSGSSKMGRPASEAPATPALFCKNSRREKPVFVMLPTPLVMVTASGADPAARAKRAHCLNGEEVIGFGNRFHSLPFYAAALVLSRLLDSFERL